MSVTITNLVITGATAVSGPGSLGSVVFDVTSTTGLFSSWLEFNGSIISVASGYTPATGVQLLSYAGDVMFHVSDLSQGNTPTTQNLTVPAYEPPVVVGCTDPDADNYDPDATQLDLSCTYSPRLLLAQTLPALVANGRPVEVTLNSAEITASTPAPATAFINVENLSGLEGVELVVNGYRFVSGPLLYPESFNDGPTLLEALQSVPALAAGYLIRLNQDQEVRLTARVEGSPGDLTITTSNLTAVVVYLVPGVNRYKSQRRPGWACFLEVWCGATASPDAQLAQRMELPYRTDNAYTFDIAPALRQFTGHAYPLPDGSCPDRLTGFYLRYGELYAQGGTVRRQQSVYQSAESQALDAVEIMPELPPVEDIVSVRLLTRRPGVFRLPPGSVGWPSLLVEAAPTYINFLTAFDGTPSTTFTSAQSDVGGVHRLLPLDGTEAVGTRVGRALDAFGETVLYASDIVRTAPALTFANGQGGFDTFLFEGTRDEITKRISADYSTPTGVATRSASTPEAFRLISGPLSRAEYLWLRRELGNTPDVYLETEAGPVPVVLSGFVFDADEVKAEWSLAVDCTPAIQPALGLTN